MKKVELSAESLASLDLAIKKKLEGDGVTGDNVCQYIQVILDVLGITGFFAVQPLGEKLTAAVTDVLKNASADELTKARENAAAKKS